MQRMFVIMINLARIRYNILRRGMARKKFSKKFFFVVVGGSNGNGTYLKWQVFFSKCVYQPY